MTTSPPKNNNIYTYDTNENVQDYDFCIDSFMRFFDKNTGYSIAMDNIIAGNSKLPDNLPDIPNIPSYTTIPGSTNKPGLGPKSNKTYDFVKKINKYMEDDAKTTLDIANDDTYDLIIQQNTMYIFGSLACASLLIASIFIGKSNS